jgi:hypothetical protein
LRLVARPVPTSALAYELMLSRLDRLPAFVVELTIATVLPEGEPVPKTGRAMVNRALTHVHE